MRNNTQDRNESIDLVSFAVDFQKRFPDAGLSHLDTLPGARINVRDASRITQVLSPGATVLDWGCGYGQMAWLLAKRGYQLFAADFPGDYLHSSLLKHPEVRWLPLTDSVRVDLPDSSVDAIVASGTLEHVQNIPGSMAEIRRVLRAGGYLFLFRFPNDYSYIEWFGRQQRGWYHSIRMTPFELRFLMKFYSLEVMDIGYDTFLPVNLMAQRVRWLRPLRERFSVAFDKLDNLFTHIPGVSKFSTSIWLTAKKNDDYQPLVPINQEKR